MTEREIINIILQNLDSEISFSIVEDIECKECVTQIEVRIVELKKKIEEKNKRPVRSPYWPEGLQ